MKNNKSFENDFIETVGNLGLSLGLNRSVGQIYGLLYLSEKPLSLDYITEKLQVSKGNVSLNIRELERWEAVKKVWVQGSRKDFYEANPDTLNIIYTRLKGRVEKILFELNSNLNNWEEKINSSKNDLSKEEEKKLIQTYKERLKKIEEIKYIFEIILKNLPAEIASEQIMKKISLLKTVKNLLK